MSTRRRFSMLRFLVRTAVLVAIFMNGILAFHAYKFTHYDPEQKEKLTPEGLTTNAKIRAALLGVSLPRPENTTEPSASFQNVILDVPQGRIHCWWVPEEGATATVILFHGYGDSKSSMVDRAGAFRNMGYNTMLVDFTGSGQSTGNATTIGYKEGAEVRAAQYVKRAYRAAQLSPQLSRRRLSSVAFFASFLAKEKRRDVKKTKQ